MALHSLSVAASAPKPDDWDGDWRCVDYDPVTGVADWYLYDENQGKPRIHFRQVQYHIKAHLDANEREYNAQLGSRWGEGKKVASVPTVVWQGLGLDDALANGDMKKINRVLNDGDYAKLRTFKGQL